VASGCGLNRSARAVVMRFDLVVVLSDVETLRIPLGSMSKVTAI
jgi:hypothetical protein